MKGLKRLLKAPYGKIIRRDRGVYDMPMNWYHSQCCIGPSVSSTGLRTIYHQSPADFWAYSDLNDDRWPPPEISSAFVYGRAAHALLLGSEDFDKSFAITPKSAPPKPTAAQMNARENGRVSDNAAERFGFWDAFQAQNRDKDVLSEADYNSIEEISEAMRKDPIVQLLMTGRREQSLIWKDHPSGLFLKVRLDVLSDTGDYADLKTTRHTQLNLLYRDIRMRGYDMQIGLATMAVENILGIPFTPEAYAGRSAILVFVTKTPPYHIIPIEIDFDAMYWARIKCRWAINKLKECIKSEHWPGPVEGIPVYTAEYEVTALADKQAAGLLPIEAY